MEKKNHKNKLIFRSKLSQYKTEKLLRCFSDDIPAKLAAEQTGISYTTVKSHYRIFRGALYYGATLYMKLFHGAGVLLMFGPHPFSSQFKAEVELKRRGASDKPDGFFYEYMIRYYSGYSFAHAEISAICELAMIYMAKFRGVTITEARKLPAFMELLPKRPKAEMSFKEFLESQYVRVMTAEYIPLLWQAMNRGEFSIPPVVWHMFLKNRERRYSAEGFYNDLRWYLLKHPSGAGNIKISNYWDDYPKSNVTDIQKAFVAMIGHVNSY